MTAAGALLEHIVDYAGLFPPASLDMPTAVANYARYLSDGDAWMLGRFVVPIARLEEFARSRAAMESAPQWRVTALVGTDAEGDVSRVRSFNAKQDARARIDSLEAKAATVDDIARIAAAVQRDFELFLEVPIDGDLDTLIGAVKRVGANAKIRTGGVVADAIPSPDAVVRFIRACLLADVPFKATAGLHHPVRAEYRLTYDADAPSGLMFGYLNVFLAAAFMAHGMKDEDVGRLLDERDASAFELGDDGIRWRNYKMTADQARLARQRVATSFGSCSFREPVDELRAIAPAER